MNDARMQPGILPGVSGVGRYLSFGLNGEASPATSRDLVQSIEIDASLVVGIGEPLLALWQQSIAGSRTFPAISGPGVQIPSTQQALWCWLRGDSSGEIVQQSNLLVDALGSTFHLAHSVDAFKYGDAGLGMDLTGYEDGTENPVGEDAVAAAIVTEGPDALQGSSFVAVQQWRHDLRAFASRPEEEQDLIIGRRKADNTEIEDAPQSAHVKRTEQESFDPPAFVLRRSMPYSGQTGEGLVFVAFGRTFDAFEQQLRRMAGVEDGIPDALFRFSRPIDGSYYWCPAVIDGHLDLRA